MWQCELEAVDPVEAAESLASKSGLAFLDSAMQRAGIGDYSYVAVDPFGTFAVREGRAYWNGSILDEPPLPEFQRLLRQFACSPLEGLPPFQGGCVGYVAYDFARRLERLATPNRALSQCDELCFAFYDVVLAFDHRQGRCWLIASGFPETEAGKRQVRAHARMRQIRDWLASERPDAGDSASELLTIKSNFSRESYLEAVDRVKRYIRAGDIYQANIAQRFTASLPPQFDAWAFYKRLRAESPAPFAAFLSMGALLLASSSPELFLRIREGQVETRPIKGTAARSRDRAEDEAAAERLQASEKDRAENVMIVDLLRNDLSRVCMPGTVQVPSLCALESYASVHHLVSIVTGRLREGLDAIDLLQAAFPGGSITGAPKLRAMDIITEIEGIAREVYCGAIGYFGFNGSVDLNIAIRTVALHEDSAVFQAGGGITLLSEPAAEYAESLAKAQRIFSAFGSKGPVAPVLVEDVPCF